jgi:hypothetical protein
MIDQFIGFFIGLFAGVGLVLFLFETRSGNCAELEREVARLKHRLALVENRNAARIRRKIKAKNLHNAV